MKLKPILVTGLAVCGLVGGSTVVAQAASKPTSVTVCTTKDNVVVSATSKGECLKGRKKVTLNTAGVQGPRGPRGRQGVQGVRGAVGPKGATGATGAAGAPGADGEDGAPGLPGLIGPPGPVGPAGAKGPAGETGPQGVAGPPGEAGPQGETGPQGDAGLKGETGDPGAAGADGEPGPRGLPGADGPVGPVGPRGATGADGPAGETGATGEKGDKGEPGDASKFFGNETNTAKPGRGLECTLGEVILTAGTVANGTVADGQGLAIAEYEQLYSLLGTLYGGDGKETFNLPDLRAVAPNGLTYSVCTEGVYPKS